MGEVIPRPAICALAYRPVSSLHLVDETGTGRCVAVPNLAHNPSQTAGKRSSRQTEVQLKVRGAEGGRSGQLHMIVVTCGVCVSESGLHFGRFRTRVTFRVSYSQILSVSLCQASVSLCQPLSSSVKHLTPAEFGSRSPRNDESGNATFVCAI